jgi:hypothetical protein
MNPTLLHTPTRTTILYAANHLLGMDFRLGSCGPYTPDGLHLPVECLQVYSSFFSNQLSTPNLTKTAKKEVRAKQKLPNPSHRLSLLKYRKEAIAVNRNKTIQKIVTPV